MVGTAVFKLGIGNVDDPAPGTVRNQMDEAKQILTRVTEPHSTAQSAFIVAGAAAHVEGDHALVLVPDVDEPVQLLIGSMDCKGGQQMVPVCMQISKCGIDLGIGFVFFQQRLCRRLVDDVRRFPFLIDGIFAITKDEDEAFGFARFQVDLEMM